MKVIFISDVKGQGKKDDIKEVKDGYAKFLITNGLAVPYTTTSINVLNKQIDNRKEEEKNLINECNIVKDKLKNKKITFKVKTGVEDRVFGSISSKQISEELSKMGFDIDKKKINTNGEINSLGTHEVTITLHKKVVFNLDVVLTK